jgi:hypothetical protein
MYLTLNELKRVKIKVIEEVYSAVCDSKAVQIRWGNSISKEKIMPPERHF